MEIKYFFTIISSNGQLWDKIIFDYHDVYYYEALSVDECVSILDDKDANKFKEYMEYLYPMLI